MHPNQPLLDELRELSAAEGFSLAGVAPAIESTGFHRLVQWIDQGYSAGMSYFADRLDAYKHPSGVLPGAKSVLALALPYHHSDHGPLPANHGKVARYTWQGADYHDVIHPKLKRLCRAIKATSADANARGVVDTAPLPEREFAELAGLGWRGKNTLLINKLAGSYFFLACVLLDIELPASEPHSANHCGKCRACLDACPTEAFPEPGVLNASKCISYLTIEHRGPIQPDVRLEVGEWAFGCDICQEVCPWNRKAAKRASQASRRSAEHAISKTIDLTKLFYLTEDSFRTQYRKTPFWRTKLSGMLRNAAVVLGNHGDSAAIPALQRGLTESDPELADVCRWAIEQIQRR